MKAQSAVLPKTEKASQEVNFDCSEAQEKKNEGKRKGIAEMMPFSAYFCISFLFFCPIPRSLMRSSR